MTGLVARVGGRPLFVHTSDVGELDEEPLRLTRSEVDLSSFEPRENEALLGEDILRHRLIDVGAARFVRAHDVALGYTADGWHLEGIDTRHRRPYRRHHPAGQAFFDWTGFQPLIGDTRSAPSCGPCSDHLEDCGPPR